MVKQSGSHAHQKKVKKVHYPSSKFESDKVPTKQSEYGLRELVKEICSKEEESLKPVFNIDGLNAKDASNKKSIHDILLGVMMKLNETIDEDLDEDQESKFRPELSKEERVEIQKKQEKLEALRKQADQLNYFTENLNDFREAAGLWLGSAPVIKVWNRAGELVVIQILIFLSFLNSVNIEL
jgi:hypothetical protein